MNAGRRSTLPSIRSRVRRCAPRTCRARSRPGNGDAARCCTRPTSTCRRSRSARVTPRAWSNSMPRGDNVRRLAKAKASRLPRSPCWCSIGRAIRHHSGRALDRGAVRLITDGDVAGVIHCADPDNTGRHVYRHGGAPEGVLAAAALRCIGGQMQCRLILDTEENVRARPRWRHDPRMIYGIRHGAGDCLFAATGSPPARCCPASSSQGRDETETW